jgi:two-component system sensor histidine kinase DegS
MDEEVHESDCAMKRTTARLSQQYVAALRRFLKQGPRASVQPARSLGRKAMALELETLDVARVHEAALASLEASSSQDGIIKQAQIFFTEVITPIETTHRAARKTSGDLNRLTKTLSRRTAELTASGRRLKRGIIQRKVAEKALKKSGKHRTDLLEQSRLVQQHLRLLTRQILSAQEANRTKISRDLHDEIAQTLLGINVRLLALKNESVANAEGLKKEIANTQRLVEKSKKALSRFVRELGK